METTCVNKEIDHRTKKNKKYIYNWKEQFGKIKKNQWEEKKRKTQRHIRKATNLYTAGSLFCRIRRHILHYLRIFSSPPPPLLLLKSGRGGLEGEGEARGGIIHRYESMFASSVPRSEMFAVVYSVLFLNIYFLTFLVLCLKFALCWLG